VIWCCITRNATWALCTAWLAVQPVQAAPSRPGAYAAAAAADAKPLPTGQRLERRFLQSTAANLRFEAAATKLALARSSNPAVTDLATTLLARQQDVQPELVRLLHAREMAMPIPTNEHGKLLKQLGKLKGAKFDRLYVDEVVTRSYQADVANFERLAVEAEDPVLRAWIERQLPTLRFHLAKAGKALPAAPPAPRGHRAM
jgi:putative membrane protein